MLAYDIVVEVGRELRRQPSAVRYAAGGFAALVAVYALAGAWWFFARLLGPPGPVGITGRVTFAAVPVARGSVAFEPESFPGQRREVLVADGAFTVPREAGLRPNQTYRVRVRGFRKTGRKYENADMSKSTDEEVQYLPERYNAASQLTVTTSPEQVRSGLTLELTE